MTRLVALSGFGTKGPACFLLEIAGRRILLDLGQGPDDGARPDLAGVGRVDAILISHGHPDHVGALDLASELGHPPIYATDPVRAFVPALAAARPLPRRGMVELAGLRVETGAAGHAPGAVWLRIGGADGLLYTGDTNAEGDLFARDPMPEAAALVFDASYGAADEPLARQRAALLALAEGGPLLLPAPAGGRGLELALAARAAGQAVALCPAHRASAERLRAMPEWLRPGGRAALDALLATADDLGEDAAPRGVMIAAGPNAGSGLAAILAPRFAASGAAQVVFTGHLARGAPGEALVAEGRATVRRWNVHPRLSEVRAMLAEIRPRLALAAFVGSEGQAALASALAPFALASGREIAW